MTNNNKAPERIWAIRRNEWTEPEAQMFKPCGTNSWTEYIRAALAAFNEGK